jgi:hypothetical protein
MIQREKFKEFRDEWENSEAKKIEMETSRSTKDVDITSIK